MSGHAESEARRRQIDLQLVAAVAGNPGQKVASRGSRVIHQSKYYDKIEQKDMLLRVIVEPERETIRVITAYKTSKVEKYWVKGI